MEWNRRSQGDDGGRPRAVGIAAAIGIASMVLLLAACGGDSGEETVAEEPAPPTELAAPAADVPAEAAPAIEPAEPLAAGPDAAADAAAEPPAEPPPVDTPPADAPPGANAVGGEAPAGGVAEPEPAIAAAQDAIDPAAVLAAFAEADPPVDEQVALLLPDADADAGRSYGQRCVGCHSLQPGPPTAGAARVGPSLFAIVDRRIGAIEGFEYSPALQTLNEAETTWTLARLAAFLADPSVAVPGTTMDLRVRDPEDIANVLAFLQSLAIEPGQNPGAVGDPALVIRIEDADVERGRALTDRCTVCHYFGEGEGALVGPNLFGIVGAGVGGAEGFAYSFALEALRGDGAIWTYNRLDAFLESPAAAIPGTRMGFAGIEDQDERAALIAYLATLTTAPAAGEEVTIGVAQEGLVPLTFSISEVQLGAVYFAVAGCDSCHGGNLRGRYDFLGNAQEARVPALIGEAFAEKWFGQTVFDLFDFVKKHETGNEDFVYPIVIAHILARNGFTPGLVDLPKDRAGQEAMGFFQ